MSKSMIISTIQFFQLYFLYNPDHATGKQRQNNLESVQNNFELIDGFMMEAPPSLSYLIKTCITRAPKQFCYAVMSRSKQHT